MSTARQQANVLVALLRRERDALAELLVALAAFDRDRGWVDLGHNSLFAFLVKDLGLSSGAAAYREAAVDLVQRFPRVLEHLRSGELCITTVFELSKVITDENASVILPRFFGTSKRDAKNVVAELLPEPAPTRTVVTAIAAPSLALATSAAPVGRLADPVRANPEPATQEGRDSQWGAAALGPTMVEPKTAELSRVHLTVPRRLLEKPSPPAGLRPPAVRRPPDGPLRGPKGGGCSEPASYRPAGGDVSRAVSRLARAGRSDGGGASGVAELG